MEFATVRKAWPKGKLKFKYPMKIKSRKRQQS